MISAEYCVLMAEYNAWMNGKVYATSAQLSDVDLYADRGAFFKSVYLTLNHLAYADLAFLARFAGDPAGVPPLGVDLYGGFDALRAERQQIDQRIVEWADSMDDVWLRAPLTYTSKVDGRTRTVARWALVTHLFNHQTHHRGQVMTLLSQLGFDIGSTDLPFMPRFDSAASTGAKADPIAT
jgi:uncharacterized damage-inducible protein DinB